MDVWTGEKDLALKQLAISARMPVGVNDGALKLEPEWDSLRQRSAFRRNRRLSCAKRLRQLTRLDEKRERIGKVALASGMLIETHAHLDYPEFAADFEEILQRAHDAGVTRIITIGTSIASSRRAIALAEKHDNIYAVIGVHPTSDSDEADDVMTPLRELAKSPRVVAIGETGLDYHRLPSAEAAKEKHVEVFGRALQSETEEEIEAGIEDGAYKSRQASLFEQQLDLAVELGLNVVIHQRDAWDDTLDMMRPFDGKLRGVFHCFGGSMEQADEVLAMGHLVSFTGIVTFKNGSAVREVAAQLALNKFMVETDCPYLAPAPFRGQRCEPAHTRLVAEEIARARNLELRHIAHATTVTAEGFFKFNR